MFIVFGASGIKIRHCELERYCRTRKIRPEVKKTGSKSSCFIPMIHRSLIFILHSHLAMTYSKWSYSWFVIFSQWCERHETIQTICYQWSTRSTVSHVTILIVYTHCLIISMHTNNICHFRNILSVVLCIQSNY